MQKFSLKLTPMMLVNEKCHFSCIPRHFYSLILRFLQKTIAFLKSAQNSASEAYLGIADGLLHAGIEGVGPFFETHCSF